MKKILLPFVVLFSIIVNGCNKPIEQLTENLPEVEILRIEVNENLEVFAELFVKNADTLYYRLNGKQESAWIGRPLAGNEQVALEFDVENSSTMEMTYTLEAYSVKDGKNSEVQTRRIAIPKASYITVENQRVAATVFSADFTINRGSGAEGFCVKAFLKEEWTEEARMQFKKDCIPEMWPTVATYNKDTLVKIEYLKAEKEYVLAVLPVKINAESPTGPVGIELVSENILELEFSTIKFGLNQTDDRIAVELSREPNYTFINVKLRKETPAVGGYILGAVKKSDAGSGIEKYLDKWLFEKDALGRFNYEDVIPFRGMDFLPCDELETVVGSLQDNTEYIIFAIAIDIYGFAGEVTTFDARTKGIEFESDASLDITVVKENLTDVELALDFNGNCAKAVYITSAKGVLSERDAATHLVQNHLEFTSCWTNGMTEARITGLKPDKEYDLWVLPKDAAGNYGKIIKKEIRTKEIVFNYRSELEINVSDIKSENGAKYALASVTKGENCETFMYLGAPMGELNTLYPDGPTPEQCVGWMLTQPQAKISETDISDVRFDIWFGPQIFIAVPMDKDGVFGTPKVKVLENVD